MSGLIKTLHTLCVILFYACVFFTVLLSLLSVILIFVNINNAEELLFPPFASKYSDGIYHFIQAGGGRKIGFNSEEITLEFVKMIIYSKVLVWICGFLFSASVFKFLSEILKSVMNGEYDSVSPFRKQRLIAYICLSITLGLYSRLFISQLYDFYINRYINVNFLQMDPERIKFNFQIYFFPLLYSVIIIIIHLANTYARENKSKNNK